jgi:uncharacterized membrane protein
MRLTRSLTLVKVPIEAWGYKQARPCPLRRAIMRMIKLFSVAGFALAVAASAEAMTPAPMPQLDGITAQVAYGCGPGRTRIRGVCVARTTIRHTRRAVRRCAVWRGGVCRRWY